MYESTKYKLLKDLPGIPKGTIFDSEYVCGSTTLSASIDKDWETAEFKVDKNMVKNFKLWFKEIKKVE